MMRLLIAAALVLAVAPAVSAAEEHQVTVQDDFFEAQHLTITAGDSVRWTNQGNNTHNVVEDGGRFRCAEGCDSMGSTGGESQSYHGTETPGDPSSSNWTFVLTFDEPGEIGYYCEVHGSPGIGMFGTITVEAAEEEPGFAINAGLTGSWFNPDTAGQGFLVDVVPSLDPRLVFAFWFTYELEPDEGGQGGGPSGLRWLIGDGHYQEGDGSVVLEIVQFTGGFFDVGDPEPAGEPIGTAELTFEDCTTASLEYELDFEGNPDQPVSGTIPLVRLTPDVLCEELAGEGSE